MPKLLTLVTAVLATVLSACTLKDAAPPVLSGPSTFAQSITLTASPDSVLQDGPNNVAAQSTLKVEAKNSSGQPTAGQRFRAEIFVGATATDFGTILPSTKEVTTGSDGVARFTYIAPPKPFESTGTGVLVTITAVPVDCAPNTPCLSDYRGELRRQVDIRVLPPGIILPPNGTPVAAFTVSPPNIVTGLAATFDASTTTDEGVPCALLCNYSWNFGDGTTGTAW